MIQEGYFQLNGVSSCQDYQQAMAGIIKAREIVAQLKKGEKQKVTLQGKSLTYQEAFKMAYTEFFLPVKKAKMKYENDLAPYCVLYPIGIAHSLTFFYALLSLFGL